jgi:plastocyanin
MRPMARGGAFSLACVLALSGCAGGGTSSSPTAPAASSSTPSQTITVTIVGSIGNRAYQPNPVAASSGDTVMFRNSDGAMHHIVLDDGSADLGEIGPGAMSRGVTIRNANATRFHCTVHPSMVGSINGSTAPEPAPCPDPYGYGC